MKSVRVHHYGGAEVLRYEDAPVPTPGPGEALVKIAVSGLNFIDVYYRTGLYKPAAAVHRRASRAPAWSTAIGPGVTDVRSGDRVAWCDGARLVRGVCASCRRGGW